MKKRIVRGSLMSDGIYVRKTEGKSMEASSPKIRIYVFSTEEGVFEKFKLNSIPFPVVEPQKVMPSIFKGLLPELRERGIYAYPHKNKLYLFFISNRENMLNSLTDSITNFVNKQHNSVLGNADLIRQMKIEDLSPADDPSHFLITRSLIYSYLKSVVQFRRKGTYIPLKSRRLREGLRIFVSAHPLCEYVEGTDLYSFKICSGLRMLFEVTPKYRGYLWVDAITEAFEESFDGSQRTLSHHEMKQLSNKLGIKLYDKYLEKARMEPKNRAKFIDDFLTTELNISDSINIKYYVYRPGRREFEEVNIVFKKLTL
jgi:DNA-binding transcriptional ArsR family regulator